MADDSELAVKVQLDVDAFKLAMEQIARGVAAMQQRFAQTFAATQQISFRASWASVVIDCGDYRLRIIPDNLGEL